MPKKCLVEIAKLALQLAKDGDHVNDCLLGLTLLVELWQIEPETVAGLEDQIMNDLKRHSKDLASNLLRIASVRLMFNLLGHFAPIKNTFAPMIYKALTFTFIDFYDNNEMRDEIIKGFAHLFKNNQTIPVGILLKPMLD